MSAVGAVVFACRYGKCTCGADGSYAADDVLGVAGQRHTQAVQKHGCRLAAETSFASAGGRMREMPGVDLCPETVRAVAEGHGRRMARFQAGDAAGAKAFREAAGEVEFTTDAGKVPTPEEGGKDLKIAVISKREAGEPTAPDRWRSQRLPAATLVPAFAMMATAREFRRPWRPRLRRPGVTCLAGVPALADGAGWIGKAVQRSLTGCVQTLDFFHACPHLSTCAERVFGEGADEARAAYEQGRGLLIRQGGAGVCAWVGGLPGVADGPEGERRRKATDRLLGYFSKHTRRLNYAERLRAGRALGSGQGEGEAKPLGLRLKRRGARGNRRNVQPMASLVCVRHTCQWDAYWTVAAR